MFSFLRKLSLKTTLPLVTALLSIGAIWLLAHHLEGEIGQELEEVLAAQQLASVERVADGLERAARERFDALSEMARTIDPLWLDHPAQLQRFLTERTPYTPLFSAGIVVISAGGTSLADSPSIPGRAGHDYSASDLFRQVMATGKPAIGRPAQDPFTHQTVMMVGVPIKDGADRTVGLLSGAATVGGDNLFGQIVPHSLRVGEALHVVAPENGIYLASTDSSLPLHGLPAPGVDPLFDRFRQGEEGSSITRAFGVEELRSAKWVPSTGWLVIATQSTSNGFSAIRSLGKEIYADAAIASVLIALLLWLYLHRQLTPLTRVAHNLDAMTRQELPLGQIPSEGAPEIRRLIESFNRLQRRLGEQSRFMREGQGQLQLSAKVFENSGESIVITDADKRILSVNHAFTAVTGYGAEEVVGLTPRLLSSGRHDGQFYQRMWQTLRQTGHWQGEVWDRRKNGEVYPGWLRISAVKDTENRTTNYIGVFSDISQRKEAEAQIEFLAYHDALTQLPNRLLAADHLGLAIAHSERSGSKTAILFLDLDNFKAINDLFGHAAGDELLKAVAERLDGCTRDTDTVSRQGGDEFLVILTDLPDADAVAAVAEKILEVMEEPFEINSHEIATSLSIGVAVYPDDGRDAATLLKRADTAMYHAKDAGRNAYRFYTEQMQQHAFEHQRVRVALRRALERQELQLHYQPQVDLATGEVIGAEALLRWNSGELGPVSPARFIPIAEESGMIVPIGEWVLREACRQAMSWREAGLPPLLVAVNVSAMQFKRGNLERCVLEALKESGLPPSCLELELTESILIRDTENVLDTVSRLKTIGVKLSIDDFGTGYSSLAYLKRFNVDKLKIDRSFVCDMLNDPQDATIVRAIIQLARSLNLRTIAEGVEDEHLLAFLRLQYCDEAQGYYFSRPLPAGEFAAYLANGQSLPAAREMRL